MDVSKVWSPVTRWADFRRRQLEALEESNRIAAQTLGGGRETTDAQSPVDPAVAATARRCDSGRTLV